MTLWTDSSGTVWELACWVKESLSSHSFSLSLSLNPPLHTVCFSTLPIAVTLIFQSHHNRTGDGEQISLLCHVHTWKKGCKLTAQKSKIAENWTWTVTNENNPQWNQTIYATFSVFNTEPEEHSRVRTHEWGYRWHVVEHFLCHQESSQQTNSKERTPIGQGSLHIPHRGFDGAADSITAAGKYALYRLVGSLIQRSAWLEMTNCSV